MIVTHPGKLGDLLWALPTVRALVRREPVHLHLSAQCKPLANLLAKQPYLASVEIDEDWIVQDTAPATPRVPPNPIWGMDPVALSETEAVVHLGYDRWPDLPLPFEVASHANVNSRVDWSPWITAVPAYERAPSEDIVLFHWTDRWFELKAGLTYVLTDGPQALPLTTWALRSDPNSARWRACKHAMGCTLENLARQIAACSLVVTDCSAVHVLAAAIGKKVVVVEPEQDRHHKIFWPGSTQTDGRWRQANNYLGTLIYPVLGIDGKPTFDARHTADLIKELLRG